MIREEGDDTSQRPSGGFKPMMFLRLRVMLPPPSDHRGATCCSWVLSHLTDLLSPVPKDPYG